MKNIKEKGKTVLLKIKIISVTVRSVCADSESGYM